MQWLKELKIALAEKNIQRIENLIDNLPQFDTLEEMHEAQYLFKEVAVLFYSLKDTTQKSMQQIQKNITFLKSTQSNQTATLDIKL